MLKKLLYNSYIFINFLICYLPISNSFDVTIQIPSRRKMIPMRKFWTNTGYCPAAGQITDELITDALLSEDSLLNTEIIAALPNRAIQNIRIHWSLHLLRSVFVPLDNDFVHNTTIDFQYFDKFIEHLHNIQLYPHIEFMKNSTDIRNNTKYWTHLVYTMLKRYIDKYGIDNISKWKFETWNEPDLMVYNLLNYTTTEYLNYVHQIIVGFTRIEREYHIKLKLHGPAGLFHQIDKHPNCWESLQLCNDNNCPFDVITYHRKGNYQNNSQAQYINRIAADIINNTQILFGTIINKFPNLIKSKFSNTESDPMAGWSTPSNVIHSNVNYAVVLIEIVLKHWNFQLTNNMHPNRKLKIYPDIESISHDNAFLSYHPYEFEQRTLLARFQMNLTKPKRTVQFIQKPVYAAFGILSALDGRATAFKMLHDSNISYISSVRHRQMAFYSSIILVKMNHNHRDLDHNQSHINYESHPENILFNIKFNRNLFINYNNNYYHHVIDGPFKYFIEYLECNTTDPVNVWNLLNRPSYPNGTERYAMRQAQGPHILIEPQEFNFENKRITFERELRPPWIILIRLCNQKMIELQKYKIKNIRFRKINPDELLIFWNLNQQTNERCIKSYDIYFKSINSTLWINITKKQHVPYLSFQFDRMMMIMNKPLNSSNESSSYTDVEATTTKITTIYGKYKIRAIDIFHGKGKFTEKEYYE